jgi:hypothetical protein
MFVVVELIVVDRRKIIALSSQRTNAPEQQPSPMMTTVEETDLKSHQQT